MIGIPGTAFHIAAVVLLVMSPSLVVSHSIPSYPMPGNGTSGTVSLSFMPPATHLKHIVTVVMENRAYDNYFGTYCTTQGPYCSMTGNGIPNGTCVPYFPGFPQYGCITPSNLSAARFTVPDMRHDWVSGRTAYDGGANDGFYSAEAYSLMPFGHYNGSTIPIYWDMAEEYAISDNFFASNMSYSLPNHWDLLAGRSPSIAYNSYIKNGSDRVTYLRQANATPTIQDLLNSTHVSWTYYDYALSPQNQSYLNSSWGSAYDYWNPLAARGESYSPTYASHFQPRQNILNDLADGSLPALSWVIPTATASDHPGYNLTAGESWVAQLVDAVEGSPDWSSTAIFVIWDDYGGWYDHVAPPTVGSELLSFRSPILVISPYSKVNFISHTFLDFYSLLRFDEWMFGLKCQTWYDCTAPMPFDFFDFNQSERAPILFPTNWSQATYPMDLQQVGPGPTICPSCSDRDWSTWSNQSLPPKNPLGD